MSNLDKVNLYMNENGLRIQRSNVLSPYETVLVDHSYVLVSNELSDKKIEYSFAVLHELAHFRIHSNRRYELQEFFTLSRIKYNRGYKSGIPFVLWDEAQAWHKTYWILKKNSFEMKGFFKYSFRNWISYFAWINKRR